MRRVAYGLDAGRNDTISGMVLRFGLPTMLSSIPPCIGHWNQNVSTDLDLQKAQKNGPYIAYTFYFGILGQYFWYFGVQTWTAEVRKILAPIASKRSPKGYSFIYFQGPEKHYIVSHGSIFRIVGIDELNDMVFSRETRICGTY